MKPPARTTISATMVLDPARLSLAADLYNSIHTTLVEWGWTEELKEDHWWPKGKPTGMWHHSEESGSFSMGAAYFTTVQHWPRHVKAITEMLEWMREGGNVPEALEAIAGRRSGAVQSWLARRE